MAEVSTATLWGRIAIFNKLITTDQWNACVKEIKEHGGRVAIDKVLVEKGYMTEQQAQLIKKKVMEMAAKQKAAGDQPASPAPAQPAAKPVAAAPKPAPPVKPVAPPKPVVDEEPVVEILEADDDDEDDDDTGIIGLAGDGPDETDTHWQPSEVEFVSANKDNASQVDPKMLADPSLAPLEIESLGKAGEDRSKLIKKEESGLVRAARANAGVKLKDASLMRTKSSDPVEADIDPSQRLPCTVAPMDMDPMALEVLTKAVELHASDVHFSTGVKPFMRLNGSLKMFDLPPITSEQADKIVLGFMDDAQQQRFLRNHDLDFSFEHAELGRARVNALQQFRGADIIFRLIPSEVPTLASLGLPDTLAVFTEYTQGLVLVTGPAGCGKSTTAAALVRLINESRHDHIITVEDPVEFIHRSDKCNVTQRQVPRDTASFERALKGALREDPDVIMIGEMRDLETVALAIRAAETGHLVIGTLQTKSAARTIDRVIDVFPSDQQATIRTMLSESLRGIISQQLVPRADGKGRIVALEVLRLNSAVSNLIRDAKTFQLQSLMQTGKKAGQVLMDDSLMKLLEQGLITREDAIKTSENPKLFKEPEPEPDPKAGKKR